jgi:hypothetical protein
LKAVSHPVHCLFCFGVAGISFHPVAHYHQPRIYHRARLPIGPPWKQNPAGWPKWNGFDDGKRLEWHEEK